MPQKRIALVGYAADYFHEFGRALEQSGFDVYWICALRSEARYLREVLRVPSDSVLDLLDGFTGAADGDSLASSRERLSSLEGAENPRIYDLILMDRNLREKPQGFALQWLDHIRGRAATFLQSNRITLVTSGRDTAVQLLIMLVCRSLGIPWVVPTRLRIPQELYGFCQGPETAEMVWMRETSAADRAWASRVAATYPHDARPLLKKAARRFSDVVRLIPDHARALGRALRMAAPDTGNDFTRYTLPHLIGRYGWRRLNMARYKLRPPYREPGLGPFCVYGLHTQPESSIDVSGAFFSDQAALVTFIARSLPVTHELYVKVHPTDVDGQTLEYYRRLAGIAGVRLINYDVDSRELVRNASIVFALTGTIAYEAALVGKPVITFARNFFNALPTVRYCDAPPRLPALIETMMDAPPPKDLSERVVAFLADMRSRCFPGEVNRMYGENPRSLSPEDLTTLQEAYHRLHEVLWRAHSGPGATAPVTVAVERR